MHKGPSAPELRLGEYHKGTDEAEDGEKYHRQHVKHEPVCLQVPVVEEHVRFYYVIGVVQPRPFWVKKELRSWFDAMVELEAVNECTGSNSNDRR